MVVKELMDWRGGIDKPPTSRFHEMFLYNQHGRRGSKFRNVSVHQSTINSLVKILSIVTRPVQASR